jgi:putative DNA primase/helicase
MTMFDFSPEAIAAAAEETERELRAHPPLFTRFLKFKGDAVWSPLDDTPPIDRYLTSKKMPRHDVTAANLLVEYHQDRLLYVADLLGGRFLHWDGTRWISDDENATLAESYIWALWPAMNTALDAVEEDIQRSADGMTFSSDDAKEDWLKDQRGHFSAHRKFWERLGNDVGRKAVMSRLKKTHTIARKADDFDQAPNHFVLSNGVLDFGLIRATGKVELAAHSSARLVTQKTLTSYEPEADCPQFQKFFTEVVPDETTQRYLRAMVGYSLLADPQLKALVNLVGPGDTGKSLFLRVLEEVFGDYAAGVSQSVFLKDRFRSASSGGAAPDVEDLRKLRLAITTEPNEELSWDGGAVKAFTSGAKDKIRSRGLYSAGGPWLPRFTLWVSSNHNIRLATSDEQLVNRVVPIRFERRYLQPGPGQTWDDIPVEQRADLGLADRILDDDTERSGILNWALRGLLDYFENGVMIPESVAANRAMVKAESSHSFQWLSEMIDDSALVMDPVDVPVNDPPNITEQYAAFRKWCEEKGVNPPQRKTFVRDLRESLLTREYVSSGKLPRSGRGYYFDRLGFGSRWREASGVWSGGF